jgi:hypothetical protein
LRRSAARLDWTTRGGPTQDRALVAGRSQERLLEEALPLRSRGSADVEAAAWRLSVVLCLTALCGLEASTLTGEVIDAATGRPIAARVYIQSASGEWLFPESASAEGSAVRYDRRSGFNPRAIERHTTLSAHPFTVELPPGDCVITVERGKEYRALTRTIRVAAEPVRARFELERWVDMASRGWFSGDTHVHRDPAELPNVQLAEDVNVVFPQVHWTTTDDVPPSRSTRNFKGDFRASPVRVDDTHAFYPLNTEYEIFTTAGKQHTLGAVLILGHKTPFDLPALPPSKIAARARAEGALLDLEKHNWPWSMAIVPILEVDLYELANNHHWRVEYSVKDWADPAPAWMGLQGSGSATEREWILYGFLNYYALLDCGFRLRPTAGTANGVHPVPLGFGRVYVHLKDGFNYQEWVKGLNAGRSFVTTGPMLLCKVDGELPGHRFEIKAGHPRKAKVEILALAPRPGLKVDLILNGEVARELKPPSRPEGPNGFASELREEVDLPGSSWIAVRCWEELEGGRLRFAHTAPWFFDAPDAPLKPRLEEVRFLIGRVQNEIDRSAKLLPPEAVAEYERALKAYEAIEHRP